MKRLFLIGYMGSGKTTIGKIVARQLGWEFIDMDTYIESRYRKTIKEIFASEGEEGFRKKEQTIVQELSAVENVVISTGGGAPCFYDNVDVMLGSGKVVYVEMTPEALASRLMNARQNRPLLKDKSPEELVDVISQQLASRQPYYKKAHLSIVNDSLTAAKAAEAIITAINQQ